MARATKGMDLIDLLGIQSLDEHEQYRSCTRLGSMSRIIEEAKNKLHQATHHGQPKSEFEQDRERILPPQVERVLDGIEQATHHDIGPANYQKGSTMDRVMDKAGEYLGHGHHRGVMLAGPGMRLVGPATTSQGLSRTDYTPGVYRMRQV